MHYHTIQGAPPGEAPLPRRGPGASAPLPALSSRNLSRDNLSRRSGLCATARVHPRLLLAGAGGPGLRGGGGPGRRRRPGHLRRRRGRVFSLSTSLSLSLYIYIYICIHTYVYIYIYSRRPEHTCVCVCVCVYVCMYAGETARLLRPNVFFVISVLCFLKC